jgi:hypothetical protein
MQVSVTKADIENVWRPLTAAEAAVIPGLSNSAWIRVVGAVPGIAPFLDVIAPATEPLVTMEAVQDVMASMIIRVLKNPESARIISESIDDYTNGRTLDDAISSGELYVSAFEVSMLTPAPVVPVNGLYVLGLGG